MLTYVRFAGNVKTWMTSTKLLFLFWCLFCSFMLSMSQIPLPWFQVAGPDNQSKFICAQQTSTSRTFLSLVLWLQECIDQRSLRAELSWADHALGYHDSHAFSHAVSLFSIAGKHLPCESLCLWFWCIGRCKMVWDRNVLGFLFSPLQCNQSYVFMLLFYISVSNLSPSLLCIYSLPHLNILQITPVFFFPTAVPIILPC